MKKLKVLSVLVAAMFCLGIVSPAFANEGILKEGTFNPNEYKETKKVSESYKAPKTKIKKSKNKIIISKGSYKKTISTKGLNAKQKKQLQNYAVKLAKQFDKKYEKDANPKTVAQIVKNIANKVNNKAKAMRLNNQITDKYGTKGLKQINNIVASTGLSKKTVFNIIKNSGIKSSNKIKEVANEVSTLLTNASERNEDIFFRDTKKDLKKAIDNVNKGIKTKEIDPYEKFGFGK
jgi:hypothetical protein